MIPKLADLHNRYLDAYKVHLTISPTTRLAAGPVDQVQPWVKMNGKLVDVFDAYGYTVFLGPPLGLPAISIPIGLDTEGMPLGIQLQARPGMGPYLYICGEQKSKSMMFMTDCSYNVFVSRNLVQDVMES